MPLPATEPSASFPVSWTGADDPGGSGLAGFTLYVSEDDGPLVPRQEFPSSQTSTLFVGQVGHTYVFAVIATDHVGLAAAAAAAAQTSTTVVVPPPTPAGPPPSTSPSPSPNPPPAPPPSYTPTPAPSPVVTVQSVAFRSVRLSRRRWARVLVVTFSGALDTVSAPSLAGHRLTRIVHPRRPGARPGSPIRLASAAYSLAADAVTLTPRGAIPKGPLRLTIRAAGTLDVQGRPIDGDHDGRPGGDFSEIVRATNVSRGRPGHGRPRHRAATAPEARKP